jgi:hypothetical protein
MTKCRILYIFRDISQWLEFGHTVAALDLESNKAGSLFLAVVL